MKMAAIQKVVFIMVCVFYETSGNLITMFHRNQGITMQITLTVK